MVKFLIQNFGILEAKLINQPSLNGLIYMHHNLFETNSDWLDIHITRNFAHIKLSYPKYQI